MPDTAENVSRQSPTPTSGPEGSDLRSVANQIEGLLDDQGHFNPNPEQLSRSHPDYNPDEDPRNNPEQGRDAQGRFTKQTTDTESEINEATPEADASEMSESEPEAETDQTEAEEADGERQESAVEEAGSETEETEGAIQTLAEMAEALDMSIDDFKQSLTATFNAAGEEVTVTLAELEKGYQKDADYRRSTGKLADERRALEQEQQTVRQQYEQQNVFLAQQFNVAEQILAAELNDPRFTQLRDSDPAEWTARREEVNQKINALHQARQQAMQQYDTFTAQNLANTKAAEMAALQEKVSDWSDEHRETAKKTMASLGYSDQELNNIFDHRLIVGALELASLRQEIEALRAEKSKAADTIKRVKKDIPKLVKPGKQQTRSKKQISRNNLDRLRARAKKSARVEDAAKVIEQFL